MELKHLILPAATLYIISQKEFYLSEYNGNAGNLVKHYVGLVINVDIDSQLPGPISSGLCSSSVVTSTYTSFYQSPTKASDWGVHITKLILKS